MTNWPANAKFHMGDRVKKTKGSRWQGYICGFYTTELTPIGYNIESETELGSVQCYPEAALEHMPTINQEMDFDMAAYGIAYQVKYPGRHPVRVDPIYMVIMTPQQVIVSERSTHDVRALQKAWDEHWPAVAPVCDHSQWDEKKHGRRCPCGALMYDPGD